MLILCTLFISITAILHVLFFKLESIDFMKARVLKRFGLTIEQGAVVKVWALNQGFYNLFLALGLGYSIYLLHGTHFESGKTLAQFILLSISGAGFVLLLSAPKKFPAALAQAVPALTAFLLTLFL